MFPDRKSTGRAFIAAALLPALFIAVAPAAAFAADPSNPAQMTDSPAAAKSAGKPSSMDHVEHRIADLHAKLAITAAQETLWQPVATVMRDNAAKMHDQVANRSMALASMTAVDDLKSYEMVSDEHAAAIKRLLPPFIALYESMTPEQQKKADKAFGEHQRLGGKRS